LHAFLTLDFFFSLRLLMKLRDAVGPGEPGRGDAMAMAMAMDGAPQCSRTAWGKGANERERA
jgi:hypothetical protein